VVFFGFFGFWGGVFFFFLFLVWVFSLFFFFFVVWCFFFLFLFFVFPINAVNRHLFLGRRGCPPPFFRTALFSRRISSLKLSCLVARAMMESSLASLSFPPAAGWPLSASLHRMSHRPPFKLRTPFILIIVPTETSLFSLSFFLLSIHSGTSKPRNTPPFIRLLLLRGMSMGH